MHVCHGLVTSEETAALIGDDHADSHVCTPKGKTTPANLDIANEANTTASRNHLPMNCLILQIRSDCGR